MEQKHLNNETNMTASEKFMKMHDKTVNASIKCHELNEKAGVGGLDSLIFNAKQRIKDSKMQNQRPLDQSTIRSSDQIDR